MPACAQPMCWGWEKVKSRLQKQSKQMSLAGPNDHKDSGKKLTFVITLHPAAEICQTPIHKY